MEELNKLEEQIIAVSSSSGLQLGRLLREIRDTGIFQDKGFEKFSDYCEAMKEDFCFGYRNANRKIQFLTGYEIIASIPGIKDLPDNYMPLRYVQYFPDDLTNVDTANKIKDIWVEAQKITGSNKPDSAVLRGMLEKWKIERKEAENPPEVPPDFNQTNGDEPTKQPEELNPPWGLGFSGASEPDEQVTINNDNKLEYIINHSNNNPDKLLALVSANYHRQGFYFTDDEKGTLMNTFDMWQKEQRINLEKIFILSHAV